MTMARVAGMDFNLRPADVEASLVGADPEPIKEHYVVVGGRRFPPKQVLAVVTNIDRADFTTHQARSVLRRLGFAVHRRSTTPAPGRPPDRLGPHGGAEAALLEGFAGRWVAQDGLEILFDAESVDAVLQWARRHGRRARVWRVPSETSEVGSAQSLP